MRKNILKIISSLLAVIIILTSIPLSNLDADSVFTGKAAAFDLSGLAFGDVIEFGSYPQSKVEDESTITGIMSIEDNYQWISYNYYSGTGDWRDGNMKPDEDMMYYKDIPYDGNLYRAVQINRYRPEFTGYKSSGSDSLQYANGYFEGSIYYFKYEPLTWRVLDPDTGFVICTKAIDSQAFNNYVIEYDNHNGTSADDYYGDAEKTYYASDWGKSSLRYWLNNDFYNTAFTTAEKVHIGTTYNESISEFSSAYSCEDTVDTIFIPSYHEMKNSAYGFSSDSHDYDTARQFKATDYALCQGCDKNSEAGNENVWWWLRSPFISNTVTGTGYNGNTDDYYSYSFYTTYGVVPAFRFDSNAVCNEHNFDEDGICVYCGKVENWDYSVSDGYVTITRYTGNADELEIPSQIAGNTVVAIGDSAFAENQNLTFVSIPDSVASIGSRAFLNCTSLKEVYLGSGVSTVSSDAFGGCVSLAIVCATSQNLSLNNAFSNNDMRLVIVAPNGSVSANNIEKAGLSCLTYEYPKDKDGKNAIAFLGETILYQNLDYNFWRKLISKYPDTYYLFFEKLTFDGIYADSIEISEDHLEKAEKYLTMKDIYISVKVDGKNITFSELIEILQHGEGDTIISFVDEQGHERTFFEKIGDFFTSVFNALSKAINAIVKIFKKK